MDPEVDLNDLIQQSNQGNDEARRELFDLMYERLRVLSRKMLRGYPGVKRWEQTDDLWQNAGVKLWKSIAKVQLHDERHFYALAATHIRRELIQLMRHFYGPRGLGANYDSLESPTDADQPVRPAADAQDETYEAGKLANWTEFHEKVEGLPDDEREAFDLIWYQGLSQPEAAELLGISLRTLKRRWQSARLNVSEYLDRQQSE